MGDRVGKFSSMNKTKTLLLSPLFALVILFAHAQDTARVMFYNLLNYPAAGGIGNRTNDLETIIDYIQPDVFLVCELSNASGVDSILNKTLNVNGNGSFRATAFHSNQSSNNNLHNMCFYDSTLFGFKSQTIIPTDLRDINLYTLYHKDPGLESNPDTTFLNFFVAHLKAGNSTSDVSRRDSALKLIRDFINLDSNLENNILGTDLNMRNSSEAGYQTITTTGNNPFYDPILQPGIWHNNPAFAPIHTQSTRGSNFGGGASGGMDDRFDQILVSSSILDTLNPAQRVHYIPDSYDAVGQDGNNYNQGLLDNLPNASVPDSIAEALFFMSDHLPVIMDLSLDTLFIPVSVSPKTFGNLSMQATYQQTQEEFVIRLSHASDFCFKISLLDLNGRSIKTKQLGQGEMVCSLSSNRIPSGIYLIRAVDQVTGVHFQSLVLKHLGH